ncbi:hypothetical protein [Tepidibacillus marianensis]
MGRVKITIRCNRCGEKFVLRGSRDKKGIPMLDLKSAFVIIQRT